MKIAQIVPTILICFAAVASSLLAGIPGDQTWTSVVLALGFGAAAVQLFLDETDVKPSPLSKLAPRAFGIFIAAVVLSMVWRWIFGSHGTAQYVDVMLRGALYWIGLVAIFKVVSQLSRVPTLRHAILFTVIVFAAIASALGLQDYLISVVREHIHGWREFGTSTPDYFAAYLLLTIPPTLALFLGAPSSPGKRMDWIYGFALILQLAVFPTTGSRFGLISLGVSLLSFIIFITIAKRGGMQFAPIFKRRAFALVGALLIVTALFAGPLLHRLSGSVMQQQAHSGDFRVWTWKGAIKLAETSPILGSGPGMFVYTYPRYAFVSFTRVAHSGYLQLLDEVGILGLIAILTAFAGLKLVVLRSLKSNSIAPTNKKSEFLATLTVSDERLLIAGLAAGMAGGWIQNIIDSDWYVTIFGATMFILAGVLFGSSTANQEEVPAPARLSNLRTFAAVPALLAAVACTIWSAAALAAGNGLYPNAIALDPYNGTYHSDYAWKVLIRTGSEAQAQAELDKAAALEPDSPLYFRRASLYQNTQRLDLAIPDVRAGLAMYPNSLELLNLGADISEAQGNHAAAIAYYRKMSDLETGVFGNVRAITEIVEYRYAIADAALGIDAADRLDPSAIGYLTRSQNILETYCDEGGSSNAMRMAQVGGGGAQLDEKLQGTYAAVMNALIQVYQRQGDRTDANAAQLRESEYFPRFKPATQPASPTPALY